MSFWSEIKKHFERDDQLFNVSRLIHGLSLDVISQEGKKSGHFKDSKSGCEIRYKQVRIENENHRYNESTFEVISPYTLLLGPEFNLREEGTLRSWLKQFRWYQDVEIGGRELDGRLTIKGTSPEWIRAALYPQRHLLSKTIDSYKYTDAVVKWPRSDGKVVSAMLVTHAKSFDQEALKVLLELVGAISQADFYGWSSLVALPNASPAKDSEFPRMVRLRDGNPVDIAPIVSGAGFKTLMRVFPSKVFDAMEFKLSSKEAINRFHLNQLGGLIADVGDAVISTGKDIRLIWPNVNTDKDSLLAGVELLRHISQQNSFGVFR